MVTVRVGEGRLGSVLVTLTKGSREAPTLFTTSASVTLVRVRAGVRVGVGVRAVHALR